MSDFLSIVKLFVRLHQLNENKKIRNSIHPLLKEISYYSRIKGLKCKERLCMILVFHNQVICYSFSVNIEYFNIIFHHKYSYSISSYQICVHIVKIFETATSCSIDLILSTHTVMT